MDGQLGVVSKISAVVHNQYYNGVEISVELTALQGIMCEWSYATLSLN
jgi:hypothetical protein